MLRSNVFIGGPAHGQEREVEPHVLEYIVAVARPARAFPRPDDRLPPQPWHAEFVPYRQVVYKRRVFETPVGPVLVWADASASDAHLEPYLWAVLLGEGLRAS